MGGIYSILKQSFSKFELLIIDDGSTDGTMEFLQSYKDPRIRIFQKQNGGVSLARNFGLQYACGRYITFIDSDDYVLQGFFEDAHRALEGGNDFLIYGGLFLKRKNSTYIWRSDIVSVLLISLYSVSRQCRM